MKKNIKLLLLILVALVIHTSPLDAKAFLKLPAIFSRNMVLQREKPVVIYGSTESGVQVNVNLNQVQKSVNADSNGKWKITFDPLPVGGPYQMTVSTVDTTITYPNILSGDVWLCSGQSNMQMQLVGDQYVKDEMSIAKMPNLRLIRMPLRASTDVNNDATGDTYWLESDTLSAKLFSAIGYYFGKKIHLEEGVPVGMIGAAWGGSTIETWISRDALYPFEDYQPFLDEIVTRTVTLDELNQRAADELARINEARAAGLPTTTDPYIPSALQHFPSVSYYGNIHPIKDFQMKGVLWYQGENNVLRAWEYRDLFPTLIKDWRTKFNDATMPFYYVQLPNYGLVRDYPYTSQWAELREAQDVTDTVPNTGMVVTIDIGACDNIHPVNKRDVGYRMANMVLKDVYGKTGLNPEFPRFKSLTVESGAVICEFEHVGDGLKVMGGEVKEFCIAGSNKVFYNATATLIAPNKIKIESTSVPAPVAVRYAWSNCPINGLYFNSYDLPLAPFRTDDWLVSTQPLPPVDNDELITMRTSKPVNSQITLKIVAGGAGTVSIDWGNGVYQSVEPVSANTGTPTTVVGTTLTDSATIRIFSEDKYITYLTCEKNDLINLDVSQAISMQYLRCPTNKLESIDLSNNIELVLFYCSYNNLKVLDVSNNVKLGDLQLGTNQVSSIKGLENLSILRILATMVNPLDSIDVSANTALQTLNLRNNGLTKLDVSKNTALTTLEVFNGGSTYKNVFTACGLDSLYRSLPDRTGKAVGTIRVISSIANPLYNDGAGSDKTIANAKNWTVTSYTKEVLTGDGDGCQTSGLIENRDFLDATVKLNPNPARGEVQLEVPETMLNKEVVILDMTGRVVLSRLLTNLSTRLDISICSSGIYFVKIGNYARKLSVK